MNCRFHKFFDRFIRFSGVPHLNRFPMPGPSSMNEYSSRGQGQQRYNSNNNNQFSRYHSPRAGYGFQGHNNNHHQQAKQRNGSDSKGSWYKAGARFGQRSQQQQQQVEGAEGVAPATPPPTPAKELAPLLLPSVQPDLIQGQMKKLAL
jgi:hypothetical protein